MANQATIIYLGSGSASMHAHNLFIMETIFHNIMSHLYTHLISLPFTIPKIRRITLHGKLGDGFESTSSHLIARKAFFVLDCCGGGEICLSAMCDIFNWVLLYVYIPCLYNTFKLTWMTSILYKGQNLWPHSVS